MTKEWKPLNVAVLGAGLGGLAAAIAMRRNGHTVTVYERYHFAGEVGASLSCASNGGKHLKEWGIDFDAAKPIILKDLIRHDWKTGEIEGVYSLGDYEKAFGTPYYNFHRIDIHNVLMDTATQEKGEGTPCKLLVDYKVIDVNHESGHMVFENGKEAYADLIIAADGIRSTTREKIGVIPEFGISTSCCYRCLFRTEDVHKLGLKDFSKNEAIEFWGGNDKNKIVLSPCSDGEIVSCYCFYPAEINDLREDGWNNEATPEQLLATFPELDGALKELFKIAFDIKQWRLYVHKQYPYWVKGKVGLLGDAAHPQMPDQSQGAVMAFEDAAAFGYIFSKMFNFSPQDGLKVYQSVRQPRANKIQAASLRARENLNERIGWSSGAADLKDENRLTIEEVCSYNIKADIDQIVKNMGL
ncbi:Salicylate hydroxylase (Salicylate 1-monooxygenase) [Scheffersomyces stipitis CBS 6054]|uniref:Salicylate hydroxylase (Salicylate 1-monooxygenase) n=1 Tax=Scheffersomyces stipitis (strain ATCC 58785 / CBS 6054 / NBRC 10063 / NRRL Y-11545) TaxID=322104 RepID=A3LSF2_PICST|nr:Salicylate hydroxylase (Salicylate 1-monooxygenase) [Scheffersomyces stipitis CBS 6054]ABN65894.1 Salicylate hydroxylase (Salicylate 1-monooxygenase) [Scheffersomyces stipitis CBS 6054]